LRATEKALEAGEPAPATQLGDRQTRRQRFTSVAAIFLGGLVAIAGVVAPLSQLHSLHEIIWWWRLGGQRPWLTWTIRGLSIFGLVAFALLIAGLGLADGSGPKQTPVEKDEATPADEETKDLGWGFIAGLIALAIPAALVLAVMCSLLAPFLGLFGLVMVYTVLADLKTPPTGE
jgi:hypothetical protein